MKPGTKVINMGSNAAGHVIADSFRCCGPNEILVVYDGTTCGFGTDKALLTTVEDHPPDPNPEKCGAGKGADCCIFLTAGTDGFTCERFTGLRDTLIFRNMVAERNPPEPYPQCMVF